MICQSKPDARAKPFPTLLLRLRVRLRCDRSTFTRRPQNPFDNSPPSTKSVVPVM